MEQLGNDGHFRHLLRVRAADGQRHPGDATVSRVHAIVAPSTVSPPRQMPQSAVNGFLNGKEIGKGQRG